MSSLFSINENDFSGTTWTPSTGPDTGFSENMRLGYERFSRAMAVTMIQENYYQELAPIVKRVSEAGGEPLMNPGGDLEFIDGRTGGWALYEEGIKKLRERAEPLGIEVPDREEIERRIKKRLPQIEERYFDTTQRQTTGGFWGELLGSAAAELLSIVKGPLELQPGMIAGAGYKYGLKAIAKAGLIDGLASAGMVGYTQPAVAAMREKYGLKYDFKDFVAATGGAFVGGAAFRVVGQGGFDASRAIGEKINPARAIGREMLETVDKLTPDQIADAFRVMQENGINVSKNARGALNQAQSEANLAAVSPFKDKNSMDAQNENAQRINAEIINLVTDGQQRIDLPPTTREVAELDVHHYDNLDQEIYRFNPEEIEVDAKTFQFKSGIDERGIVSGHRLEKETRWDPALSGTITVYEYANGQRFIADGHQRLGLAQRIQANDPSQEIKIYGRLIKETDGHTPEDAMIDASLVNIANTPLGDEQMIIDAAKVMRIRPEALKAKLPPRSQFVRRIYDLVELSNESFQLVINGIVPTDHAAIVGRLVKDPSKQEAILRVLKDTEPSNLTQAEAIVRQAMDTEFTVTAQSTLFGEEMLVESLFKERARILDETIKMLRKDRAVFNSLVENQQRIEAGGNKLETSQNVEKAKTDGQAIQILQVQANRKGPLSDALTEAAKAFKESGRAAPSARAFADDVRGAIERGDLDGIPERGEIIDVDAPPQIDRIAASHVERLDDFAEPGGKGYENQADLLEREVVEVAELDGADDLLDMMVPTGENLKDANGNNLKSPDGKDIPEMRSVEDIFREIEQDKSMLDRLRDCV